MESSRLTFELRGYSTEAHSHHHDYHQIVLPVAGELSLNIDGREGRVDGEQLAVIQAGSEHAFEAYGENCFIVADIPITLIPDLDALPAFIAADAVSTHYIHFLYQQLNKNISLSSKKQMLLLMVQLLQEHLGKTKQLDRRVEIARVYIDQHFTRNISLTELASIAYLSTRQLSELFCSQVGVTPQQYLIEKRMQLACELLELSSLSSQP